MSMRPGITVLPVMSMTCASADHVSTSGANTALMRFPSMTTEPGRVSRLTASNTRPPRSTICRRGPVDGLRGTRRGSSVVRSVGARTVRRSCGLASAFTAPTPARTTSPMTAETNPSASSRRDGCPECRLVSWPRIPWAINMESASLQCGYWWLLAGAGTGVATTKTLESRQRIYRRSPFRAMPTG